MTGGPIVEWQSIDTVPFNRDVELAVVEGDGTHPLAFPCRRDRTGWVDAETNKRIYYIRPTHWRDWSLGEPSH
jgi:hypothetical protein